MKVNCTCPLKNILSGPAIYAQTTKRRKIRKGKREKHKKLPTSISLHLVEEEASLHTFGGLYSLGSISQHIET